MTQIDRDLNLPQTMNAVLLTGHGGPEMLQIATDVPLPISGPDEVLIEVRAAGVNNTDINTRTGWYSKTVTSGSGDTGEIGSVEDGGWEGKISFPRIQGADCFGTIVAVGANISPSRIGEPVLVTALQNGLGDGTPYSFGTFGSECNGAFAQYCTALSAETHHVKSTLSEAELGAIPCAYSTAEGMLQRANVTSDDHVLVTGASGGVGLAAVQLASLRGCKVTAQSAPSKAQIVRYSGAEKVIGRDAIATGEVAENSFDVVVDVVAGPQFTQFPAILRRGGRYVAAGAIAGPMVNLDVRDLYLKDLSFLGSTWQPKTVFDAVIDYVNRDLIKPVVSKTYPLFEIGKAQEDFMSKKYPGKLVLIP